MTAAELRAMQLLRRLCREENYPQLTPLKVWVDKRRREQEQAKKPKSAERPTA